MAFKMYIVVNKTVGMKSIGKVVAQTAHGIEMLYDYYLSQVVPGIQEAEQCMLDAQHNYLLWSIEHKTKIVLECTSTDTWNQLKSLPRGFMVIDLGLTEVTPGSETVIVFWPMDDATRPNVLKLLKPLKNLD
jgi:peptidyl-tRNA hydrolase